ncbi:MAG: carboxypeptidase-like regulatory domain-containing protein [Bacteroidota bacterium]
MRFFIQILFFVLFIYAASGQQMISGKVVDAKTGESLLGAHIYLLKNWRMGVITDLDGRFQLDLSLEDMSDSLIVSYVGFEEQLVPMKRDQLIKMKELKLMSEAVVVTASPLVSEEFKYVKIKKMEIYTNPAAKADPLLAVNSLPSSTTTDESANISLRGSSPIETGVFFNNVPIYDAVRYSQLNGIGTFSIFNTDIIKEVTVFPGNPPLEFGNATSGIISMQTDDNILQGNANSFVLSLANIGYSRQQKINENSSFKLFTNWQPSGPIRWINQEALEDITSFNSNDLGLYWYGSNTKLSWKILGYGVTEGYQFNFKHPSFQGIFDQKKKRTFLISTLEKTLGAGTLAVNNGFSYSNGDFGYSNVRFNVLKRDVFAGINYLIVGERYNLKTGLSYDRRDSELRGNFHEFGFALGADHPTFAIDEDATVEVAEAFGYFKYYVSEKIALGTGLRKNLPVSQVDGYLSKQANVSFIDGKWNVTFGIGNYHKNGLRENTGEPFAATNDQTSLDIKWSNKGLDLAVSIFDKDGTIDGLNYSAKGAEFFADYRFSQHLRASGSLTLLDAESNSDSYIYDLSYFVRANVSWNPAKFWTIESTLVGRQGTLISGINSASFDPALQVYEPIYDEVDTRLSSYLNIGIAVSKVMEVTEDVSMIAFASLSNVLNRENIRGYEYNFDYSNRTVSLFSQRTGYLGVVVNF